MEREWIFTVITTKTTVSCAWVSLTFNSKEIFTTPKASVKFN